MSDTLVLNIAIIIAILKASYKIFTNVEYALSESVAINALLY